MSSSSGSSNEKKKNQSAKKELKALKEYLNKTKKESKTSEKVECFEIKSVNPHNKVNIDLMVYHKKKYYALPAKDGMSVTWQRKNTPGKLTFTTYTNKISCGDMVTLKINSKPFFAGSLTLSLFC